MSSLPKPDHLPHRERSILIPSAISYKPLDFHFWKRLIWYLCCAQHKWQNDPGVDSSGPLAALLLISAQLPRPRCRRQSHRRGRRDRCRRGGRERPAAEAVAEAAGAEPSIRGDDALVRDDGRVRASDRVRDEGLLLSCRRGSHTRVSRLPLS